MSEAYKYEHVRKAIDHGVSDFICTPTIRELKVIWKFVQQRKLTPSDKKRRDDDERTISSKNDNNENAPKKPRWTWTDELHEKFIFALKQLGLDQATPKKILELMNVPNLAKHNVSSYLQKFRKYIKEKGTADWTQITTEMTSNQIGVSPGKLTVPEPSISRFNMQSYAPIVPMPQNSNLFGQSDYPVVTSAPLARHSNYMGQNFNYMHQKNASIMGGVNNMHVQPQNPNPMKQYQTRNISAPMQQNYSSVVNQTDNSFTPMAKNQLNMGQKYAPTAIFPLRNDYSLLNQLQNNVLQIGKNENHIQRNKFPMSNLLENNSANIVQKSNAMWNSSSDKVQLSNATENNFTVQGFNNFEMVQNFNAINQDQNCFDNFTGNSINQNSNAMELNSVIHGIDDFGMIPNNIVGQNEYTDGHYQGYNIFSDVNENIIGYSHSAMGSNSVIQGIDVGMMPNRHIGINEYMGAPNQGQGTLGSFNGNFIDQTPNDLRNSSAVQGNGVVGMIPNNIVGQNEYADGHYQGNRTFSNVNENIIGYNHSAMGNNSVIQGIDVGMMHNRHIGINEYMGAPNQGQSTLSSLNGNFVGQNPNDLRNSSAVQGNGVVGMIRNHQIGINEHMSAPYQGQYGPGSLNENFIGRNPNALENSSSVPGNGVVGMMQNQQISIDDYMGAPFQGRTSIGALTESFIGQNPNTFENSSTVQGNGVVGMMHNQQIGINEYMSAPYQGQCRPGSLNGNYTVQHPNVLGNSSAVKENGVVGMMGRHSIRENAYTGVASQAQNCLNAVIGNSGAGSSERAVNVDDFVSELLNLDAEGEEPNN